MRIGIGIDTGGTYTDAVAFDFEGRRVVASAKARTTKENLEVGICDALRGLPEDLRAGARFVALSTTLATNACVEDKGGRAKLILMGTTEKVMRRIGAEAKYGLKPADVLCLDTKGSFDGSVVDMPDWDAVIAENREWLAGAQAIALCEANAARNGAVVERAGKKALQRVFDVPYVMGCELSSDLNMMARGATALLNARLLPVVRSFLEATERALRDLGIAAPVMIVRSDGSLMGRGLALDRPVETILSGPAASVHGSHELAELEDGLIVDMGGTTTDISLVVGGRPVMTDGIRIGSWQTQAKGVFIETFGLGGDSAVRLKDGELRLSERRVEPISAAAERWPQVTAKLRELLDSGIRSSLPFNELLYLVREPADLSRYTRDERRLVRTLREGPCLLGERDRIDIYSYESERLENEGIVIRAGLTPTDIMQLKGDFQLYGTEAAELSAQWFVESMAPDPRTIAGRRGEGRIGTPDFCDAVYDAVEFKLYANIVKILVRDRYPKAFPDGLPAGMDEVLAEEWERARGGGGGALFDMDFSTRGKLVGIGAPTHIFLPAVARALGAECVIPEHAGVANAVGAVVAGISATRQVVVEPKSSAEGMLGFLVHAGEGTRAFEGEFLADAYRDALSFAREDACRQAEDEARRRGAVGELELETSVRESRTHTAYGDELFLGATVTATASEREHVPGAGEASQGGAAQEATGRAEAAGTRGDGLAEEGAGGASPDAASPELSPSVSPEDAEVERLVAEIGFDAHGTCAAGELHVRPEVREMCSSGNCHVYGKNWACPPACGPIEEFQRLIDARGTCHVVQTVMKLENEFDGETMVEAERVQKRRLQELAGRLREEGVDALVLAAGTCTVCKKCAYPESCRFPERRLSSMEAAGLLVSEVCTSAGVPYNHGKLTIAYTSCVLV